MDLNLLVKDLFFYGLKAVEPYTIVKEHIGEVLSEYKTGKYETLLTIGFGKAAYQMALAVKNHWEICLLMVW